MGKYKGKGVEKKARPGNARSEYEIALVCEKCGETTWLIFVDRAEFAAHKERLHCFECGGGLLREQGDRRLNRKELMERCTS